jgi:RHS repeat-associated protein
LVKALTAQLSGLHAQTAASAPLVEDFSQDTRTASVYEVGGIDHLLAITQDQSNFRDAQGAWQNVDTSLSQDPTTGDYSNAAGPVKVTFPSTSGGPVSEDLGPGILSMTPAGTADVSAQATATGLTYSGVSPGIDLQRTATPTGFEELVILTSPPATETFGWDIQAQGLSLQLDSSGAVSILSGTHVIGQIPVALASDASPQATPDAFPYLLDNLGNDQYHLAVQYDRVWLDDPARTYPVQIDPVPHLTANLKPSVDTFVPTNPTSGCSVTTAQDTWTKLQIGGANCHSVALVTFNLNSLPSVHKVVYSGYSEMLQTSNGTSSGAVNAYRVTQAWSAGIKAGDTLPTIDTTATGTVCGQIGSGTDWWAWPANSTGACTVNAVDMGALYAGAMEGGANNGVEFKNPVGDNTFHEYNSSETANDPFMVLYYNSLPNALTSSQLGCTTGSNLTVTTDSPLLCVTAMPTDRDPSPGDPTRVSFEVSTDPTFQDPNQLVAQSPWLNKSGTVFPAWSPPSGALRDGTTYYWHAVSGDWCVWTTAGDPPSICPNVDAAGNVVARDASPAVAFTVSLPHFGTDPTWDLWTSRLGNGMDLHVNKANGNVVLSYPMDSVGTPAGPLALGVTYNNQRAGRFPGDPTMDQGLSPGWLLAAGPQSDTGTLPRHVALLDAAHGAGVDMSLENGDHAHFSPLSQGDDSHFVGSGQWQGTITRNTPGTTWTYVTSGGGIYQFDANGNLTSATGSSRSWGQPGFSYSFDNGTYSAPVMSWVRDPLGRQVTLSWSALAGAPRLTSLSTWVPCVVALSQCASGTTEKWAFAYDTSNRLSSITDPSGGVVAFTYEGSGNFRLTGIQDGMGHTTSVAYQQVSGFYRGSTITEPGAADPVAPGAVAPSPTQFGYSAALAGDVVNTTSVTDPRGTLTSDATDYETWTDFDMGGRPIQVLGPYQLDPVTHASIVTNDPTQTPVTKMAWNDQGGLLCRRTPLEDSAQGSASCVISGGTASTDTYQTDYTYASAPPYPLTTVKGPLVATSQTTSGRATTTYSYDEALGSTKGLTDGLLRTTFDGKYLSGLPVDEQIDPTINFGSASDFCPAGCTSSIYSTNYWSSEWSGMLKVPTSGAYQFQVLSAHGATVSIGGNGVLGCWTPDAVVHQVLTNCGTDPTPNVFPILNLKTGTLYPISISYFWDHATSGELRTLKLQWRKIGASGFTPVDSTALLPNTTLETTRTQTPGPQGESSVTTSTKYTGTDPLHRRPTMVTTTAGTTAQTRAVTYTYDSTYGMVTDQKVTLGAGVLTTHTDYNLPADSSSGFCVSRILDPQQFADSPTGASGRTDYTCDASGETTRVASYIPAKADQPAQTRVVDTTYDNVGRVLSASVPHLDTETVPGKTQTLYDAAGRPTTITDPMGFVTASTYNDQGLLEEVQAPDKDTGQTTTSSATTLYGYDQVGNRTDVFDPLAGGVASGPHHWSTQYDEQNLPVAKTIPTGTQATPGSYQVTTTYSLANLTTTTSAPGGPISGGGTATITTTTTMDLAGRTVSEQSGTDALSTSFYDVWGNTTDQIGRGVETTFSYNAWQQVVAQTCKACWQSTPGVWSDATTYSSYDQAGRLTKKVDARAADATDTGGAHTWTYTYDKADRILTASLPSGITPSYFPDRGGRSGSDNVTTFTYDAAGDQVQVQDGAGYIRTFTTDVYHPSSDRTEKVKSPDGTSLRTSHYDLDGRLTQVVLPGSAGTQTYAYFDTGLLKRRQASQGSVDESFTYDAAGNRTAATTTGGTSRDVALTYDLANRPLSVAEGQAGSLGSSTYAYQNSQVLSRTDIYGATTNTTSLTYQSGDGLPSSLAWTTLGHPANTSSFGYDTQGRLTSRDDPTGTRTAYGYDNASRLSSINVGTPSGPAPGVSNPVVSFARTFDQVGNVATETRTVPGYATTDAGTWTYSYDNASRLSQAQPPGGDAAYLYDYDGAGNRARVRYGTSDAKVTFDANGYPDYAMDGAVRTEYTVDSAGRLTSQATGADTTTYSYDGFARLIHAVRSGGGTTYDVTYQLDALDRTITRTPAVGAATTFAYVGTSEQPAFAVSSTTMSYFYAGPSAPLAEKVTGTNARYYVADPHGDIVAMVDKGTGALVVGAVTAYDAFGSPRGGTNTGSLLGYQGQITDSSTGLVDMLTRNYLPGLGRFTTQDSFSGQAQDPTSLNQFIFAANNPATLGDPTGQMATVGEGGASCPPRGCNAPASDNHHGGAADSRRGAVATRQEMVRIQVGFMYRVATVHLVTILLLHVGREGEGWIAQGSGMEMADNAFFEREGGGLEREIAQLENQVSQDGSNTGETATEDAGLASRANEIHGALDPIAQNSRTTAVLGTQEGPNVIASGGRDLSPIQRALTGPDDVLGRLPSAHAEVTALDAASRAGLTPSQMAVSRPICLACQAAIEQSGGQVGSNGLWARWPW